MNRDATLTRTSRLTATLWRGSLLACLLLLPGLASAAAAAAKIDLDAFDARKRSVALPDGERLAYLTMGDPAGTPVVLIHGYTDSASDWVPLIPYLSPKLRIIVVDLRGHGRSGKPECCYARWDFAYDVKLLLDSLGIGRVDLVGHSMGSIVTQAFAEAWPERTRRVVLISSTAGVPPGGQPSQALVGLIAVIRELKDPIVADSEFMKEWWASETPVDERFLRRKREESAAMPARVWLAVLDQELDPDFSGVELRRTLPRLAAPALLIWGSKDPLISEDMRQTLREALPQAEVKIFPGLGHNPFWEEPAQCAAVINSFLTGRGQ